MRGEILLTVATIEHGEDDGEDEEDDHDDDAPRDALRQATSIKKKYIHLKLI